MPYHQIDIGQKRRRRMVLKQKDTKDSQKYRHIDLRCVETIRKLMDYHGRHSFP